MPRPPPAGRAQLPWRQRNGGLGVHGPESIQFPLIIPYPKYPKLLLHNIFRFAFQNFGYPNYAIVIYYKDCHFKATGFGTSPQTRICTLFQLTPPGPLTLPPTTSTVAITVAYVS